MQKAFVVRHGELLKIGFVDSLHYDDCDEETCVANGFQSLWKVEPNGVPIAHWPTRGIDRLIERVLNSEDVSPRNYIGVAIDFYMLFHSRPISGKSVLIVGSATPWLEAIAVGYGAAAVVSVDFKPVVVNHPSLKFLSFEQLGDTRFDVIISFSSIEHAGLGRYGDPIDPDLDAKALVSLRKYCQPETILYLGLPTAWRSALCWNHHRIYDRKQIQHIAGSAFTWNETLGMYADYHKPPPYCKSSVLGSYTFRVDYDRTRLEKMCKKKTEYNNRELLDMWQWQPIHVLVPNLK